MSTLFANAAIQIHQGRDCLQGSFGSAIFFDGKCAFDLLRDSRLKNNRRSMFVIAFFGVVTMGCTLHSNT
jgi:hypothetical protein